MWTYFLNTRIQAFQACFDGAVTTGCTRGCLDSSLSGLPGSRICYAGHSEEEKNYSDLKLWVNDRFISGIHFQECECMMGAEMNSARGELEWFPHMLKTLCHG